MIDPNGYGALAGVFCASTHLWVAVDVNIVDVDAQSSTAPTAHQRWRSNAIDSLPDDGVVEAAVSCGSSRLCGVIDTSDAPTDLFLSEGFRTPWRLEPFPNLN